MWVIKFEHPQALFFNDNLVCNNLWYQIVKKKIRVLSPKIEHHDTNLNCALSSFSSRYFFTSHFILLVSTSCSIANRGPSPSKSIKGPSVAFVPHPSVASPPPIIWTHGGFSKELCSSDLLSGKDADADGVVCKYGRRRVAARSQYFPGMVCGF